MKSARQLAQGLLMALVLSALALGSLSLSLLEGGYALAEAPTAVFTIAFSGQQIVNLAGVLASQTATPPGGLVIYTPTALACAYPAGWVEIVVAPDQTLNGLAQAYATTIEALQGGNCMTLSTSLIPGSLLRVPPGPTQTPNQPVQPTPTVCRPPYGWVTYLVRPGDTLARLAAAVQMTPASLLAANCLNSSYLYSGQMVSLPYYPAVYYPTATYRPPTYWPTPWASPTRWASPTYGPSPTFPWLPSTTPTPPLPPLTTWTPFPSDTPIPPATEPPPTIGPPTEPPPTIEPPTEPPPTIEPPTEPPPTVPPPPTEPPPTIPPPTIPPPPTEPPPTIPPPPTPTTDTGFPFP